MEIIRHIIPEDIGPIFWWTLRTQESTQKRSFVGLSPNIFRVISYISATHYKYVKN